jgi:hypothetical protein
MPLTFESALVDAGIDPKTVRLLRHVDSKADYGRTPYELFRNDRAKFELYQSHQNCKRRPHLKADHWASFVGTPDMRTLFCELYASRYVGVGDSARLKEAWIDEHARWRERDLSAKAVSHRGCRSGIETSGTLEALDSIIVPGTHSRSHATNL